MAQSKRIAVAMSGGVDSSTAAALLAEQGYEVFGIMLRLWSDRNGVGNRCCSPTDIAQARRIAGQLDIPFYVLDVQDAFKLKVVDFFIQGYQAGLTPNPCMECNRLIRWTSLLNNAVALGATHLATGHYARVTAQDGMLLLQRARDRAKDQSYVLSVLSQGQLRRAVFPLGGYLKAEVREHARRLRLPVAERRESQDLCFVGEEGYRPFLARHAPGTQSPGQIVDPSGQVLGQHGGLADFTIGQRKGIGLSGPAPLYVIDKEVSTNRLIVGPRQSLGRSEFDVERTNWIDGRGPHDTLTCAVRVRYKADEVDGRVTSLTGDRAHVSLSEARPDVTPGQAAVFYDGEICLGGGTIAA